MMIFFSNIFRAPADCVQYFTGVSGNVQSYNFGNQILQSQTYSKYIYPSQSPHLNPEYFKNYSFPQTSVYSSESAKGGKDKDFRG